MNQMNRYKLNAFALIAFSLVIFVGNGLQAMTCDDLMDESLATSTAPFNLYERIGARGFLTSVNKVDGAQVVEMKKHLIMKWLIEIYIVPSIEAARAHDMLADMGASQGVYLIDPTANFSEINVANKARGEEIFKKTLAKKPIAVTFRFPSDSSSKAPREMTIISADRVQKDIIAEGVELRERAVSMGPHFKRTGWAYPKDVYGEFEFSDLIGTKTYKTLMSRARKLQREGVTFGFSLTEAEFRADLKVAAETERKDQKTVGQAYFDIPDNVESAVTSFKEGHAFTIRAVRNGKVLGGILVFKEGKNILDFFTTFYVHETKVDPAGGETKSIAGILYSQITGLILFERIKAVGLDRLYIDMVSKYSQGLKGKRASMQAARVYTDNLEAMPALPYDFKTPWTPPVGGD